jgi:hypothetical protein
MAPSAHDSASTARVTPGGTDSDRAAPAPSVAGRQECHADANPDAFTDRDRGTAPDDNRGAAHRDADA